MASTPEPSSSHSPEGPVVVTEGGAVRGRRDGDIAEFRGIRYARAPIGPLRFRPPEPVPPWTGEYDATGYGPAAIQSVSMLTAGSADTQSEDCLSLNIWTPALGLEGGGAGLPVMVWIHGGSFTTGSGSIPWYEGANLARRGVVVVSINYRLGALGFLHLESIFGAEAAGAANLGLLDQAAALAWVRDHIAPFGGDPARVTIFGESAGAMSVSTHLALPASDGLFHHAIAQSGAAAHVHDHDAGARICRLVLETLGVSTLPDLRALPAQAFVAATEAAEAAVAADPVLALPFSPTIDGSTLPDHPLVSLRPDIPLLIGSNRDEMRLWEVLGQLAGTTVEIDEGRLERRIRRTLEARGEALDPAAVIATYRSARPDATPKDIDLAVGADLTFRIPAVRLLEAHGSHAPTFAYLFTHESTSMGGILGCAHATEIPFVFDNLHQPGVELLVGDVTDERAALAAALADTWVAFAVTGRPDPSPLGTWPVYEPGRRSTMVIDLESSVVDDPSAEERRLWSGGEGL